MVPPHPGVRTRVDPSGIEVDLPSLEEGAAVHLMKSAATALTPVVIGGLLIQAGSAPPFVLLGVAFGIAGIGGVLWASRPRAKVRLEARRLVVSVPDSPQPHSVPCADVVDIHRDQRGIVGRPRVSISWRAPNAPEPHVTLSDFREEHGPLIESVLDVFPQRAGIDRAQVMNEVFGAVLGARVVRFAVPDDRTADWLVELLRSHTEAARKGDGGQTEIPPELRRLWQDRAPQD